jgi:alpha-L-arabinofuranosidase
LPTLLMKPLPVPRILRNTIFAGLALSATIRIFAQSSLPLYTDTLVNGWTDGSYKCTYSFANASPVHSGSASISATVTSAYGGIQLNHSGMANTAYTSISFWLNGGASGGQQLQMYGTLNNVAQSARYNVSTPTANTWQQYIVPLSALGVADVTSFTGFAIQDKAGTSEPTFYLDDIQLISSSVPVLVHVGVNAAQPLRAADARWFGLNTAIWDSNFDTPSTSNALKELGTQILRFPGGSLSDFYHWNPGVRSDGYQYDPTKFANFVHIATNAGAQAIITVNYGTGTSNEAAAWVTNVKNNNYGFMYWEIGNECYGTWEADSNTYPHDPYTYAVRAAGYITLMKQMDPTIKIGVPVVTGEDSNDNGYSGHPAHNSRTGFDHNGWTPVVLTTLKSLGVTPDFLIYHVYPEYQSDSDAGLLQASGNWAGDAPNLRQQISDYLGAAGTNIELICTENNADAGTQGRQSTSIVNGLYLADSLAQLMKTEFNGFVWWDLRNGQDNQGAGGDFNASLYGWRTYGDLGIIGNANTRYPTFFTFKLMQYFACPGDNILNATTDYGQLSTYAARKADGALALLVINKDSSSNLTAQITLTNFVPWSNATARSFGIAQDEATRTNSVIPGAKDIATNSLAVAGANFIASFPPYSLTLLTLAPAAPVLQTIGASGGQYIFQLQGQPGVPYVIQNSADLAGWISVVTNTLSGSTLNVTNTINSGLPVQFWRAVWVP